MVDTNRPRLKVSRAGIVLIKSFESFRPRAVQREDGRWVIGYGHTASAREGLTVGEPDAELLLQYDLIPVAKALNEQVEAPLNQHQFDALASFAVSVGVDGFLGSDVLKRVNAGQTGEAADALINQTGAVAPDSSLRRRAAERALFVADPAAPVLLADLLAAPLPPPPVVVAPEPEPEPVVEPVADAANDPAPLSRAAAVASLLGEPHEPQAEPEAPVEVPAPEPEPEVAPEPVEPEPEAVAEPEPEAPSAPPSAPPAAPLPSPSVWAPQKRADVTEAPNAAFFQRYSPYSSMVVGPLPGFPALGPDAEPEIEAEAEPVSEPEPVAEPEAPVVVAEAPVEEVQPEPEPTPEPVVEPVVEAVEAPVVAPVEPLVVAPPRVEAPVELPVFGQAPTASPFPPLELTPAVEADFVEVERPVWGAEQRAPEPDAEETVLFEDEPPLAVLRHEVEPASPRRFDWIETGPYMIMGGLGLFSCAASAAAFRKAMSDRSPLDDFSVIAWVLALIGVICVGVSAWNLYRKAGKRDGDEG